ncbi:hypothetical protein BH11BAC6_BH11BAC6_05240 [soil metagenome]
MKKILVIAAVFSSVCLISCGSSTSTDSVTNDTTHNASDNGTPATGAPDNSDATNPSIPDTMHIDSTH